MLQDQINAINKNILPLTNCYKQEKKDANASNEKDIVEEISKKEQKVSELSKQLSDLKSSSATILVCGEFKRGKSTFINALIGRNICPTDTEICTSVVSVIKYGIKEKAIRYYGDFSNLKSEPIPFEDIEKYTVGSAAEIGNTISLELELPLDELKKGLVIIDTPGVGGLDPRHVTLTNYFLPHADIAFFMTDVNEPLSSTELDFYKNVVQYAKHSAIIVNKADLKDPESVEEIRKDTINKISVHTQVPAESLDAISVSAADCIKEEEGLGNFAKVHTLIERMVNEYKSEQLAIIRDELSERMALAITPLQAQIDQIENPQSNQINVINQQKGDINQKLLELSNSQSAFRLNVNKKIQEEKQSVLMDMNKLCSDLSSTVLEELLKDSRATSVGTWLGEQLNNKIVELSSIITLRLNNSFNRIASFPEFNGLLNYCASKYQGQFTINNVNLSVPFYKRIMAGMSGYGFGALAIFGNIPIVGQIVLLGTAAYVATMQIRNVGTGTQVAALRQVYIPQIQTECTNLRIYLEGRFTDFQQELIRVISERVNELKDSLDKATREIQSINQQINVAVTKKAAIQKVLNPLKKAKEEIDQMDF